MLNGNNSSAFEALSTLNITIKTIKIFIILLVQNIYSGILKSTQSEKNTT